MANSSLTFDITKWEKQFQAGATQIYQGNTQVFVNSCTKLWSQAIKYSPVGNPSLWAYPAHKDYKPGTLKKSWQIDFSGDRTQASVYNTAPYAMRVEYGWSKQAPEGMLRRAIKEFPDLLKSSVR